MCFEAFWDVRPVTTYLFGRNINELTDGVPHIMWHHKQFACGCRSCSQPLTCNFMPEKKKNTNKRSFFKKKKKQNQRLKKNTQTTTDLFNRALDIRIFYKKRKRYCTFNFTLSCAHLDAIFLCFMFLKSLSDTNLSENADSKGLRMRTRNTPQKKRRRKLAH